MGPPGAAQGCSPLTKTKPVTVCVGWQRILPFEAVLLNSLRRLLTFVPQTNDLLTSWERTTADSPGRERALSPAPSPTKGNAPVLVQCNSISCVAVC